jgi:TolB-like protein
MLNIDAYAGSRYGRLAFSARGAFVRASMLIALALLVRLPLSSQAPQADPLRVSVLYFENTAHASDFDWLSKGLADMIAGDLGSGGGFVLVEREELEKILREQELGLSGLVDPASAPKVGQLLGADLLIYGSFVATDGKLRIDAKAVRAQSGVVANSASVSGRESDALSLERDLAVRLASGLGVTLVPVSASSISVEAARAYYRGVDRLDAGEYTAALEYFSQATQLDPLYLKPGKGMEDAYRFLKDFRRQRYRREMNALVSDIEALAARIQAVEFYSFADALSAPAKFGFKDAESVSASYQEHPNRMAGDTPVEAIWNLQNLLGELADAASENFGDDALASRCQDEILRWSDAAEKVYPKDPFLPEVLYQKIFVYRDREQWESVRSLCERLMTDYPDYRMMWAVEDIYEAALKSL